MKQFNHLTIAVSLVPVFFVLYSLFFSTPAQAQEPSCTDPETCEQCNIPENIGETIPCGVICPTSPDPVLFLYGNNYRACATDSRIPAPALGSRNESWYFSKDYIGDTILYNGSVFNVPDGGVYVCDSDLFGCGNSACSGVSHLACGGVSAPGQRGCEDPLNGPKDKGCYGATVTKGSPDDSIWDTLLRVIKEVVFKWGGSEQKIEVQKLTIPIEYDLRKLLGTFPGGTPAAINEETLTHFQSGVLPKLTPPGPPLESLHQKLGSYLDDYSKGILDAESCKAPGLEEEKDVEVNAPDVWGLANTAIRLAFSLVELPGSTPPDYAFNAGGSVLASQRVPKEAAGCKSSAGTVAAASNVTTGQSAERINNSTATTPPPTITLARSNGECPYGPGKCPQKTEAPDKDLCIRGAGELGEEDEERMCSVDWQTFDCTPNTVFTCPNLLELSCNPNGTVDCPSSSCPGTSENKVSLFPKISFLPDYTKYIIKTYKLFLTPGTLPKPLDGKGEIEWSYAGVKQGDGNDDDNPTYPELGTTECLEDYVKRVLSPPGHGLTPKEDCFEEEAL